jgi:hypothetical protein
MGEYADGVGYWDVLFYEGHPQVDPFDPALPYRDDMSDVDADFPDDPRFVGRWGY